MKYSFFIGFFLFIVSCAKDQDLNVAVTVNELNPSTSEMSFNVSTDTKNGNVSQVGILYRFAPNINLDDDYRDDYGNYRTSNAELNTFYVINIQSLKTNTSSETISVQNFVPGATYYAVGFVVVNGKMYFSDEKSFRSPDLDNVKTGPAGGIVIYEDGNGGGIEVTPFYLNYKYKQYDYVEYRSYIEWGCSNSTVVGTQEAIGTGKMNTDTILVQCNEANIAARMCNELSYGGFNDWYLPSKDELLLAPQKFKTLGVLSSQSDTYWTSSKNSLNNTWIVDFYEETASIVSGGTRYVIAARSF